MIGTERTLRWIPSESPCRRHLLVALSLSFLLWISLGIYARAEGEAH